MCQVLLCQLLRATQYSDVVVSPLSLSFSLFVCSTFSIFAFFVVFHLCPFAAAHDGDTNNKHDNDYPTFDDGCDHYSKHGDTDADFDNNCNDEDEDDDGDDPADESEAGNDVDGCDDDDDDKFEV